jgi:trimeric autotransporter adhesin
MKTHITFIAFALILLISVTTFSQTWENMGTGANGKVYTLAIYNNDLLIGGEFTSMDGNTYITCLGLAHRNGPGNYYVRGLGQFNHSAVLDDIPGACVNTAIEFDNRIHLGGNVYYSYYYSNENIGYLEYDSFSDLYTFEPYYSNMNQYNEPNAMAVFNYKLYIGGNFQNFIGNNYIAVIDSGDYPSPFPHTPGSGLNGTVNCLAVYNGALYAGGAFTMSGSTAVNNIAKYDGTSWSAVGSGMNGTVYSLTVSQSALIAGGTFTDAGGTSVTNIAKWNGTSWSALGGGISGGAGKVLALESYSNHLFAGGSFTTAGSSPASNLAQWDGSNWSAVGTGTNGTVRCFEVLNNMLYMGGDFTTANGSTSNYVVAYTGTSGIEDNSHSGSINLAVCPNPAYDKITINLTNTKTISGKVTVSIYDETGLEIRCIELSGNMLNIDISSLSAGMYYLRVKNDGRLTGAANKFIKLL